MGCRAGALEHFGKRKSLEKNSLSTRLADSPGTHVFLSFQQQATDPAIVVWPTRRPRDNSWTDAYLRLVSDLVRQEIGARLCWTGGVPPFQVQKATDLSAGNWQNILTNAVSPVVLPVEGDPGVFRILGQ